jgi:hypothetical protein
VEGLTDVGDPDRRRLVREGEVPASEYRIEKVLGFRAASPGADDAAGPTMELSAQVESAPAGFN